MRTTIYLLLIAALFMSCNKQNHLNIDIEKEKILKMHNAQRDYHFNKDSIAFVNQLSKSFISVNKGQITMPKAEENTARYHHYFSSVEFIKWDDVAKPIIKFSEDGSMAYTIVDKIVAVTYKDENEGEIIGKTHFAWTAIYKKYGDEWKIDCATSTNKPIKPQ